MSNKLTLNKVDLLCEKQEEIIIKYNVDGEEIIIKISPFLSLSEELTLINTVAEAVVSDEYRPNILDVVFFATYLRLASNISLPTKKDPENDKNRNYDLEKINKWMNLCKIKGYILQNEVLSPYIKYLSAQIDKKIDFELKKQANNTPINELIERVNRVIDNFGNAQDNNWGEILELLSESSENNELS